MRAIRPEVGGRIVYDASRDEFFAQTDLAGGVVKIDRPISAGCLLTRNCNLRCRFCYGDFESLPMGKLTAADWSDLFRHMHDDWGLMRVDLSGGEPTLRTDCAEIARAAFDAGLNVVLSTNGTILYEKGLAGFPPELGVHVSFDSGFEAVHEASRLLPTLSPSAESFAKTSRFVSGCLDEGRRVRALTCLGQHNCDGLFALGEHLARLGVLEWNISHVLPAGRAQGRFEESWSVPSERVLEQVEVIGSAFPWMVVRYSNRTDQDGYFLLVLNDGTLATQYTDGRDKVVLGAAGGVTLDVLRSLPEFNLKKHITKWIAAELEPQPAYSFN